MISMDVLIQKTPHGPLSLGCAEPALPEGEPRVPIRYVLPLRPLFQQCGTPHCWLPFPENENRPRLMSGGGGCFLENYTIAAVMMAIL